VATPPASNEPLDVGGRSGLAERQQALLSLLRGDSREGAHLGIRELAASERVSHARQCRQRACDPDALARGAKVHPDAPREPGGAGTKADVPAPAVIELTDEAQEASSRRVEMGRELGDLVTQSLELGGRRNVWRARRHAVSLRWGNSKPCSRRGLRASPGRAGA